MRNKNETSFTHPPKLTACTEEGGHWYQRLDDGGTFILTREDMRDSEHRHINPELTMPGYDPIWCYGWKQFCLQVEDEVKVKEFLSTKTEKEIQQLQNLIQP